MVNCGVSDQHTTAEGDMVIYRMIDKSNIFDSGQEQCDVGLDLRAYTATLKAMR